jgi:hypothetical protein
MCKGNRGSLDKAMQLVFAVLFAVYLSGINPTLPLFVSHACFTVAENLA